GTRIASSSEPPLETMPVMTCPAGALETSPIASETASPTFKRWLRANVIPTTHSNFPSENHLPSIRHHGLVLATPVENCPPSARAMVWFAHVPITGASSIQFPS